MAELEVEKHVKYILAVEKKKDDFESVTMVHLRMNGAYWGLTTLDTLDKLEMVDIEEVVSWVMKCQHESGGFGGNIGHDPQVLYTLSNVQILALFDKINMLDIDRVLNYIAGLQNKDGSFSGDIWGEVDTRHVIHGGFFLSSLIMIDRVQWINKERPVRFILDCQDKEKGGISDRPVDALDVFHTYFGVAGLSLSLIEYSGLKPIDPAYALPVDVVNRIFCVR